MPLDELLPGDPFDGGAGETEAPQTGGDTEAPDTVTPPEETVFESLVGKQYTAERDFGSNATSGDELEIVEHPNAPCPDTAVLNKRTNRIFFVSNLFGMKEVAA